ncbi:hypothetical protein BH23VER1_BH23VER1_11260 [soil metagenome]
MKILTSLATGLALATALGLAAPGGALAAPNFDRAEVTRILNQVRLLLQEDEAEASVGAVVAGDTAVRTGSKSRAELTFPNEAIVRLGSNTLFNFQEGSRDIDLRSGTILVDQPSFRGRTQIRTAAVTAAITGTTVMVEFSPGSPGIVKMFVLDGKLTLALTERPRDTITLGPGEMVVFPADTKVLPAVMTFDLKQLVATSGLVNLDPQGLNNWDKILAEIAKQEARKGEGSLIVASSLRVEADPIREGEIGSDGVRNMRLAMMVPEPIETRVVAPPPVEPTRRVFARTPPATEPAPPHSPTPPPAMPPPIIPPGMEIGPDCSMFENFQRPECAVLPGHGHE